MDKLISKKLRNIASLQMGVYRRPADKNIKDTLPYVKLSDFDGLRYKGESQMVKAKDVKEKYLIHHGDVLFSMRVNFNAFILPENDGKPFVASNGFAIIRPNTENIMTQYLAWFLNNTDSQREIEAIAEGVSRVPFISLRDLGDIDIEIPDVRKQQKIINIHQLRLKEKALLKQLEEKKDTLIQEILKTQIK